MKSKLISFIFILTFIMLIVTFKPIVLAEDTTYTYQDFEYTINDKDEITITKYVGSGGNVTIPSIIDEKNVTSIGEQAFYYCTSLTDITIPNSVTSIDFDAFSNCTSLTNIIVDENNVEYADLDGVLYNKNKDKIICYPMGKQENNYTIPNSVTSIGEYAFSSCTSLTNITIPNSVTSIGKYAFYKCTSLTDITIPNSVTSIESFAFYECSSLTNITLPNNVTSIGISTFCLCTSLNNITIPNSVTSIGPYAFYGCSSLINITIPNSVTSIDFDAFSNCTSLTKITIPNSVTSIGNYVFSNCTSLTNIIVDENNVEYADLYGVLYNKNKDKIIYYPMGKQENNYTIPNSVTSIGSFAFYECTLLTDITIPNSVTSIGEYAFFKCTSLTDITIPNSVTSIERGAFSNCTSLTKITIPNSVTSIGSFTFYNCSSLTIYLEKNSYAETYAKENNLKYEYIDSWEFEKKQVTFKSMNKTFSGIYGYWYRNDFFLEKNTEYNHHLGTMSLCLAFSAYNKDDEKTAAKNKYKNQDENVKKLLEECEFVNYEQYHYNEETEIDNIACAIASKKIDETTIIAVAIRGGGYGKEWGSNFTVEKNGDHDGFNNAANIVYNRLKQYIKDKGITRKYQSLDYGI